MLKAGWKRDKFANLLQKVGTIDPAKQPKMIFKYVDVSSVSRETLEIDNVQEILGKDAPSRARRHIKKGDVLFATIRPTLKRIAIIPDYLDDQVCSTGYFVFRATSEIYNGYIFYYLLSKSFSDAMESLQKGASYPAVNDNDVKDQFIIYPPLPEQKRIVAILDEAFANISQAVVNAEKNLANARELFDSYLNEVFTRKGEGWEEKTVSEIADHCLGKMLDKNKNKGTLKPYLRNVNVRWFDVDTNDLLEMRFEESEFKKYSVKKGDLLICEGGYPGRAAIWNDDESIFFQKAIHRVRCKNPQHNAWIMYFLYLSNANGNLKKYCAGAGIQHFTGQSLAKFRIPIVSDQEVTNYLKKIRFLHEKVKELEDVYRRKLAALAELKQALLQKAFTGELTANYPHPQ